MSRQKERDRVGPKACPVCGEMCRGTVAWREHIRDAHDIDADPDDLVRS